MIKIEKIVGPIDWYKATVKTQLTRINDELLEFYNRPGMALHFHPSNLKQLKEIIEKLIFLEELIKEKNE